MGGLYAPFAKRIVKLFCCLHVDSTLLHIKTKFYLSLVFFALLVPSCKKIRKLEHEACEQAYLPHTPQMFIF